MNEQTKKLLELVWLDKVGKSTGGLVIPEQEVAHFLCKYAGLLSLTPCVFGETCEVCNVEHALWWDWETSLSGPIRIRLQEVMRDSGIPFPPSPWEEVPTNAVPTSLN